jgi:hypothetical protein
MLNRIKAKDKHPFFTMYSICHEGVSTPVIVGEGSKKISWFRKAIQSIKNIVTRGVKFFKGHNKDNSHRGRKVLGKVIHSFEKIIEGKLHHVVIGYHPESVRDEVKNYDVCSQESEWNILEEGGKLIADTIESLTGIALANSEKELPAFAGAKRLGYIQAFESTGKDDSKTKEKEGNKMSDTDTSQGNGSDQKTDLKDGKSTNQNNGNQNVRKTALSFQELKSEAKRMGAFPSQLFTVDEIKKDREFAVFFNELEMMKDDKVKTEKQIEDLKRQNSLSTAKDRLNKIMIDEKPPKKIEEFISNIFDKEKESIDDLSDDGLKKYIDNKTVIFQQTAKIIDPDFDIKQTDGDAKTNTGDLKKAENNELLEEDYEEE